MTKTSGLTNRAYSVLFCSNGVQNFFNSYVPFAYTKNFHPNKVFEKQCISIPGMKTCIYSLTISHIRNKTTVLPYWRKSIALCQGPREIDWETENYMQEVSWEMRASTPAEKWKPQIQAEGKAGEGLLWAPRELWSRWPCREVWKEGKGAGPFYLYICQSLDFDCSWEKSMTLKKVASLHRSCGEQQDTGVSGKPIKTSSSCFLSGGSGQHTLVPTVNHMLIHFHQANV